MNFTSVFFQHEIFTNRCFKIFSANVRVAYFMIFFVSIRNITQNYSDSISDENIFLFKIFF